MTHLAEADSLKDKQRHGFFSVPVSTAIGDDGEYKTRIRITNSMQTHEMRRASLKLPLETSRPRPQEADNWPSLS